MNAKIFSLLFSRMELATPTCIFTLNSHDELRGARNENVLLALRGSVLERLLWYEANLQLPKLRFQRAEVETFERNRVDNGLA